MTVRSMVCACALALLTLGPTPTTAWAKAVKTVGYRYGEVWSAAIRLIRVDRSFDISDKDKDNGYILFVYPGSGRYKKCPASLELVEVTEGQQTPTKVRVQLSIEHQPSYVAVHLLDKLETKLRVEQGPPREAQPKPKPTPPPAKDNPAAPTKPKTP